MSDASLRALRDQIENGSASRLRPGSCSCWYSNEREKFGWDRHPFAQRGVDKVQEFCLGECGVQIHQFGSVDDTATTNSQVRIRFRRLREIDGLFYAVIFWLHP